MEFAKLVFCASFSAVALFIITKLMGHKQMAQLDLFDYITGITIGSIAAEMATELDEWWKPLFAMLVYGVISVFITLASQKFPRTRKYLNGAPTVIMCGGKLYRKNLKKARLDLTEFMVMCRQEGYFNLNEIETAIFEYNGRLTVLPKSESRPLTPSDVGIFPKKAAIDTELILDGRILGENLHRRGLDEKWLLAGLRESGYKRAAEILLATVDEDNVLTFYPINTEPNERQN